MTIKYNHYHKMGVEEKGKGNYLKSLECYNKHEKRFPRDPDNIHKSKGKILHILGRYDEAEQNYIDSLLEVWDVDVLVHLGHSIVDKQITSVKHGSLAEEYRGQIDPYFELHGKKKYTKIHTNKDYTDYILLCIDTARGLFKEEYTKIHTNKEFPAHFDESIDYARGLIKKEYQEQVRQCSTEGNILNNNVEAFKKHLNKIEITMEEFSDTERTLFRYNQKLKNGPTIGLVIGINHNSEFIDFNLFDFVSMNNPLKEDLCYRLMNDLNANLRFATFFLDSDKDVALRAAIDCTGNFVPETVISIAGMLVDAADNSYGKFMKILWS